jgi:hypothetical protein
MPLTFGSDLRIVRTQDGGIETRKFTGCVSGMGHQGSATDETQILAMDPLRSTAGRHHSHNAQTSDGHQLNSSEMAINPEAA